MPHRPWTVLRASATSFHPTCRLRGSTTCQTRRIKSVSSEPRSGPRTPAVAPNKTTSDWGPGQGSVAESTVGSGPGGGGGGGGGGVMAAEEGGARPHTRGPTRRTHVPTDGKQTILGGIRCVGGGTCGGVSAVGAAETRPQCPLGLGGAAAGPSLLRRVTCGPEGHVIGAAPGTSGEGQNPAQEARTHFSQGVSSSAGVPPLSAVRRDSWNKPILSPTSSPASTMSPPQKSVQDQRPFPFREGHSKSVEVTRRNLGL